MTWLPKPWTSEECRALIREERASLAFGDLEPRYRKWTAERIAELQAHLARLVAQGK